MSQVPPIRSFEFDKNAIGQIKSSVNKFRGSVSLPIDLLTLPGRQGLDVKLSVLYSSNIRNSLDTWNSDAPTSSLGLGWQMPIEMVVVEKAGCGSTTSDSYYLVSGGSANPLVKTGQTSDGKWIFQPRNFQFWSVSYDRNQEIWTVVKENGFIYVYGSGGNAESNATQWGVKWGNWIGASSRRAGQSQYALAWNLASIQTPMGHRVSYFYENVAKTVMADGLEYTQASYLKTVVDSFGQSITFNYGEKFGALNPSQSGQPIVEYQAAHTSPPAPNAYQDRYETRFLDSVDVANADGNALFGLKFTYTFVNHAPTSAQNYSLLYKRCLSSVFQYTPDGETRPAMAFEYVDQNSPINPGALSNVVYPSGGNASFAYKQTFIASPKKLTIPNPLPGSVPRVWFGPDYVVFTYVGASGMRVVVRSWNGQWVTQDLTQAAAGTGMGSKTPTKDSLNVLAGDSFIAISFRNSATNNDELYCFRNDDRGAELRFGTWKVYTSAPFVLSLTSPSAGPSTFVAGADFVIACNKAYAAGPVQGFSYAWQTGRWNSTLAHDAGAPPLPSFGSSSFVAIAALQNYYVATGYVAATKTITSQAFYRGLDGSWNSSTSNPWTATGVTVVTSGNELYLAISPMPTGMVLTYVTATSATALSYSLNVFVWDESFHVLNAGNPAKVNLQSPIANNQPQLQVFRTLIVGSLVNNNLALLRNAGGDQSISNIWVQKMFTAPSAANATVVVAAGDDVALCSATSGSQSNQLATFNPNSGFWSTPPITQTGNYPTISGDYMTVGRSIYVRGGDGSWTPQVTQLNNLTYPESIQNYGPHYLVYQDVNSNAASTCVVALKNGTATLLPKLSAEKCYVPASQSAAGTRLSSPRFLVTYPASATSLDTAATLNLYDLDDVNFDQFVVDTPVALVQIEDAYDSTRNYSEAFYYANSSESAIVYDAASGVAHVPGGDGRSRRLGRGRYAAQRAAAGTERVSLLQRPGSISTLYPSGGIQNYQNTLNGIELGQNDYDSANKLVGSRLNYWTVYSQDSAGRNLFGAFARCERTTLMQDGITQECAAGYDRTTGVMLWQDKSYVDATGAPKRLREATLYAWQVPEYSAAFLAQHDFSTVAMATRIVTPDPAPPGSQATYIQSRATTYRNWANSGTVTIASTDGTPARLAAYQIYDWTTPGTTAPQFSFSGDPGSAWQLKTQIVSRSPDTGVISEQIDGSGLVSSFIYDKDQSLLVAQFPGGSLAGHEVSYCGFESYEADQA